MNDELRRVVTAQIADRGTIASDESLTALDMGGGARLFEVWRAPRPDGVEAAGTAWDLNPPRGGSVFRIAEFPGGMRSEDAFMHITQTIDYGVILEGELTLIVDDGEVALRPGDVFVQRQANHAWHNRGDRRCRMAVILIDGAQ